MAHFKWQSKPISFNIGIGESSEELKPNMDLNDKIYRSGNSIYFNDEVSTHSISHLIWLTNELINEAKDMSKTKPKYFLHINSYGGAVDEMFRFADYFETIVMDQTDNPTSIVHGMAASAGSYIAAIFPKRMATKRSTIMWHELWSGAVGVYTHLQSYMESLNSAMGFIIETYCAATGKSEEFIRQELLRERWMNPQQALEYGLIQKII